MRLVTLAIALTILGSIAACAQDSPSQEVDKNLTGERFFDAAASKLIHASNGMQRTTANCIVRGMTADGRIGIGEINQSILDERGIPTKNTLRESYIASSKACD